MVLMNKQSKIIVVPIQKINKKEKTAKIRRRIQLIPGANEVTTDEWTAMKELVGITSKVDNGKLVPILSKENTPIDINSMEVHQRDEILAGTYNLELLEKWYKGANTPGVATAIKARLDFVKTALVDNPTKENLDKLKNESK